jgi:hypothetical protein
MLLRDDIPLRDVISAGNSMDVISTWDTSLMAQKIACVSRS